MLDCPGDAGDETAAVAEAQTGGWHMIGCDFAYDQGNTLVAYNADGSASVGSDGFRSRHEALTYEWPILAGMVGELCLQELNVPWVGYEEDRKPLTPNWSDTPLGPVAFQPIRKDANHAGGANLLYMDTHVEWLTMVDTSSSSVLWGGQPPSLPGSVVNTAIPNPYIEGDECIYEAQPPYGSLRGDTFIRYYACIDPTTHGASVQYDATWCHKGYGGYKCGKDLMPPGSWPWP